MSQSLPKPSPSTHLHSLDVRMAKASIVVHSPGAAVESVSEVSLVLDSLNEIGMSDKEACIHMEFDASQFSKVKKGEARLPFDALWKLPTAFWVVFRRRVDEAKGLTEQSAEHEFADLVGRMVTAVLSHRIARKAVGL